MYFRRRQCERSKPYRNLPNNSCFTHVIAEKQNKCKVSNYNKYDSCRYHPNLQYSKIMIIKATAPNGAYCRIMACRLIFLAALRYFSESVRSEAERCDIPVNQQSRMVKTEAYKNELSSESPRHSSSSIFLVIILVTS